MGETGLKFRFRGGSLGISLLIILLIPTGIYFTIRTKFFTDKTVPGYGAGTGGKEGA